MMDPIEAPAEVKKTGHRWLDLMLSLSAIFVSACSLYLAQDSSRAMERLVQANSMPFLQLGSGNATDDGQAGVLAFSVHNAGTGPASIHSFAYVVDGREIPMRGFVTLAIMRACCAAELDRALAAADGDAISALGNDLTSPIGQTFLAAGEEAGAWQWTKTTTNQELWQAVDMARQGGRITTRACYCSLFDECWIAETQVFPPRPVETCSPQEGARATPP
jgi:hypothetical protein